VDPTIRHLPPFERKSTKRAVTPGALAQSLGLIDPFARGSDDVTGEMAAKRARGEVSFTHGDYRKRVVRDAEVGRPW
jgi:hypothetical protein